MRACILRAVRSRFLKCGSCVATAGPAKKESHPMGGFELAEPAGILFRLRRKNHLAPCPTGTSFGRSSLGFGRHRTCLRACPVSGLIPRPLRGRGSLLANCVKRRKRHPMKLGGVFVFWWSRRESNPRPQALRRPLYILRSPLLILTVRAPVGRLGNSGPPRFNLASSSPMQGDPR